MPGPTSPSANDMHSLLRGRARRSPFNVGFPSQPADPLEIGQELRQRCVPRLSFGNAQDRRRMKGDEADPSCKIERTSIRGYRDTPLGERECRRGAQGDDDTRLHVSQLAIQPPSIVYDLRSVRLLMQPLLAAADEVELLHGVGQIAVRAGNSRRLQCGVEELACRTDERPPFPVLSLPRLLTDQSDRSSHRPLAGHDASRRLRGLAVRN